MSPVSIVKVERERAEDAVYRAVELAGGLERYAPGSTVLIEPNVMSPSWSGSGKITDARVTEAVTRMVLERDPQRVIIGEGSAVGYDLPGRVDAFVMGAFAMAETAWEADVIVCLPVIKTHVRTGIVACAIATFGL